MADETEKLAAGAASFVLPVITVDVERYDHLLADSSLSPDERAAVLQQLWNIVVAFVDFGFRVEPCDAWGQEDRSATNSAPGADGEVKSEHQILLEKFVEAASQTEAPNAGGSA